jgi:hypothetical protein
MVRQRAALTVPTRSALGGVTSSSTRSLICNTGRRPPPRSADVRSERLAPQRIPTRARSTRPALGRRRRRVSPAARRCASVTRDRAPHPDCAAQQRPRPRRAGLATLHRVRVARCVVYRALTAAPQHDTHTASRDPMSHCPRVHNGGQGATDARLLPARRRLRRGRLLHDPSIPYIPVPTACAADGPEGFALFVHQRLEGDLRGLLHEGSALSAIEVTVSASSLCRRAPRALTPHVTTPPCMSRALYDPVGPGGRATRRQLGACPGTSSI